MRFARAFVVAFAMSSFGAPARADDVAATRPALSREQADAAIAGAIRPLVIGALEAAKAQAIDAVLLRAGPDRQAGYERLPIRAALVAAALEAGMPTLRMDNTPKPDKPLRQQPIGLLTPKWVEQQEGQRAGKTFLSLAYRTKGKDWMVDAALVDAKRVIWRSSSVLEAGWVTALGDGKALNDAILAFARKNVGVQVGNGECWTLAAEAVKVAGAKRPDDYVFGRELEPDEAVAPGDILHFESVRIEEKRRHMTLGAPHHVAVIEQVLGPNRLRILHQNFGGDKTVQSIDLNFAAMTEGKAKIYRAVPRRGESRAAG